MRQVLYSHTLRVTYGKEQHKEERTWHWKKELINGKGVKTTYHRIDSISMVDGIEVTVKVIQMKVTGSRKKKENP